MSGYAGVIHLDGAPPDPALIKLLSEKLAHRGRDGQGILIGETWAMAHCLNRLTKTLQSDVQPLTWGDLTLVSDARIDGRRALIDRLRSMQEDAADDASDAALILHAFRAFGERCVEYLIGDYTFALWNSEERSLFTARDPLGKRSLYYALTRDAFIFSNELRPIRLFPGLSQDLDPVYIADFLALGDGFWIDRTITPFTAIHRLDRGHSLTLRGGTMSVRQFWSLPEGLPPLRVRREADVIEQFNAVFREAVRDRLNADRVVLTLSGGMDSSTVTAVAVDILRKGENSAEFTAITSVYTAIDDPELLYGVQNAQALGIQAHHVLHRTDHYALLRPYYHIANAIRQHLIPGEALRFKEALASLGNTAFIAHLGDELGGGGSLASYLPQMRLPQLLSSGVELWRYFGKRPALGLWSYMVGLLKHEPPARGSEGREFPPWIAPDFERHYGIRDRWAFYWDRLAELGKGARSPHLVRSILDPDHYVDDEFVAADFVPADSVDPFADVRLIAFLLRLDPLPWLYKKYLLRRAMQGILPDEVLRRPKQILGDLAGYHLAQPQSAWIDQWTPTDEISSYIVRSAVPKITGANARAYAGQMRHMRPLMLDLWLRSEAILRRKVDELNSRRAAP
ncbi:MAG: asparagine synthase-related protein [Anaerolineae bacterium]|nr:asparagine synthase-related protein [Anaerolineae bacterium]NUQ02847.1 hypothetical protein [Anaerolineae bacterium]